MTRREATVRQLRMGSNVALFVLLPTADVWQLVPGTWCLTPLSAPIVRLWDASVRI